MAATIVKEKGSKASVSLEGENVIVSTDSGKWVITREGVKRV